MYTRYYDSYPAGQSACRRGKNNEPEEPQISCQNEESCPDSQCISDSVNTAEEVSTAAISPELAVAKGPFGGFGNLKADDILLIAVLLLIMSESKDDFIMPLILGYLFLGEIF